MLFQESAGVPDIRRQRKVYPIDPFLARLPARRAAGAHEPDASRLAEAAIALAIFRAVEGDAVDSFNSPDRLFLFRSRDGAEVDFVILPDSLAAESKYVDEATRSEARAMVANFGGGLLITRTAIDPRAGVTIIPAAIFTWLLDQRG